MAFAEGVAARDQRDGFLIVHRHAGEGFANVATGGDWIRRAVRAFRVDVDQAHLNGAEGRFKLTVAGVALIAEPFGFGPPVDVLFRLPHVGAAAGETEGLPAHGFDGAVARKDHQIGPAKRRAVFLLDRPQQAAGLVEVAVVGPGVQRSETLRAGGAATASILHAVGACGMPGHADHERAVVAIIRRPPVLAVG